MSVGYGGYGVVVSCLYWLASPDLFAGMLEDILAVGVEAQVPETNRLHETLCLLELTLPAEQCLNEFDARALAQLRILLLAGLEHRLLACLEQLPKLVGEALAGLDEVLHHLLVVEGADPGNDLLRTLDLASQLDKQQPEVTGHIGNGSRRAVQVDRPVEDPLAEAIGIENGAKKEDGLLGRVPVLQ